MYKWVMSEPIDDNHPVIAFSNFLSESSMYPPLAQPFVDFECKEGDNRFFQCFWIAAVVDSVKGFLAASTLTLDTQRETPYARPSKKRVLVHINCHFARPSFPHAFGGDPAEAVWITTCAGMTETFLYDRWNQNE
jgi:hypothetical protein